MLVARGPRNTTVPKSARRVYREGDSNPHASRLPSLSRLRLPFRHPGSKSIRRKEHDRKPPLEATVESPARHSPTNPAARTRPRRPPGWCTVIGATVLGVATDTPRRFRGPRRARSPGRTQGSDVRNQPQHSQWISTASQMCEACARRACGSCPGVGCGCFSAFEAWEAYHAATIRPITRGRDNWTSETAVPPPHNAYRGRHERNLAYRLGADGSRQGSS